MQSRQLTIPSPDSVSQRVEWVFGFMTVEAGIFRSMKKEKGKTDAFRFTRGPGARLLSDAEGAEDQIEDVFGGGGAGDFVEGAEGSVEIEEEHLVGNSSGYGFGGGV